MLRRRIRRYSRCFRRTRFLCTIRSTGLFSFFLNVAEGKEFAAGVVEDTVYDDFDTEFVGFFTYAAKSALSPKRRSTCL